MTVSAIKRRAATRSASKKDNQHFHRTKDNKLVACYHECKNMLTSYSFWIGMSIGWPLEHFLWQKIWPFSLVAKLLGI